MDDLFRIIRVEDTFTTIRELMEAEGIESDDLKIVALANGENASLDRKKFGSSG